MELKVKTMADYAASGESPEILFWVGCAGSFDQRAEKVTRAFVKILNHLQIKFAVLGTEESCTGDPAKRAGDATIQIARSGTKVLVSPYHTLATWYAFAFVSRELSNIGRPEARLLPPGMS